jgi:DNA-binding LacI/PurR family transcriptional regulator
MRILEHVAGKNHPVSPTQLEEQTRIAPATVTRSLASLVGSGYLQRVGRGKYVLGRRMKDLASCAFETRDETFLFLQLFTASYDEIYAGVSDVLGQLDSQCLVYPLGDSLEQGHSIQVKLPQGSPGVFFYSRWKHWSEASGQLGLENIPAVHIGYGGYDACDTVSWDEREGISRLTSLLIEQGSSRLIYLGNRKLYGWDHSVRFRRCGYRDTVLSAGLEDEELLMGEDVGATLGTCRQLEAMVSETPGPLGVVCDDFELLPGLIAGLDAAGLLRPDKLRVAASILPEHSRRFAETVARLSAWIVEPWREVGRAAARRLLQRLAGRCEGPELTLLRGPEARSAGGE